MSLPGASLAVAGAQVQQQQQQQQQQQPRRAIVVVENGDYTIRLPGPPTGVEAAPARSSPELDRVALREGRYYTTIDEVWETQPEGPRADYISYFCRGQDDPVGRPASYATSTRGAKTQLVDAYFHTYQPVFQERERRNVGGDDEPPGITFSATERASHNDTAVREELWPSDVYGLERPESELAHLAPTTTRGAMTWWFLCDLMFGQRGWSWAEREMLINGSRPNVANSTKHRHCGIKHMASNKARIPGHAIYMDMHPCLLIVPILSSEQVRNWSGEAYEAIVMIDKWDGDVTRLKAVAYYTRMNEKGWIDVPATPEEIDTAGCSLRQMMLAIRSFICESSDGVPEDYEGFQGRVTVPSPQNDYFFHVPYTRKSNDLRVRKIQFSAANRWTDDTIHASNGVGQLVWEGDAVRKHMAPDPMLLLSRACLVFSSRHHNRFAGGAEELESPPGDENDWMHEWEEERLLDRLRESLRPPTDRNELARALGLDPDRATKEVSV